MKLKTYNLSVPLRTSFKHHTAERKVTETVVCALSDDTTTGFGESCPRIYVTGESVASAIEWIASIQNEIEALKDFDALKNWQTKNKTQIDSHTASWCAVEIAALDYFAKKADLSIEQLLGIPELSAEFRYSAVVSDEQGPKLEKILSQYLQMGFSDFKFKLSGDQTLDREKFTTLEKLAGTAPVRMRIDANNIWPNKADEAIEYIRALERKFFGIEEPLGDHDFAGLSKLSVALDTAVILDESLIRVEDIETAAKFPGKWMPNLRVSKVGGIQRSLDIAAKSKALHCPIIVGSQVGETSILSRAALSIVNAYRDQVVAQEGAYGTILVEKDIASPEVRFGFAGKMTWKNSSPGLGLTVNENELAAGF